MDPRAKDPEQAYKNRQAAALNARKTLDEKGIKAGPKVHKTMAEYFAYTEEKLESDRSDIGWWIQHYKRQPFFLRAQIANSEKFHEILLTMNADIGLGLYKVSREEWNALTILFNRLTKMFTEQKRTERKKLNKENAKFIKDDDKGRVIEAVRVHTDDG